MKYIKALIANYFFFVINTIFFLIITPSAIHVMGEDFFGLFSILNAITLFSGVGTLGMASVVNKFAAEEGEGNIDIDTIFSSSSLILLPMALITSIILIALRGFIATRITSDVVVQQDFCNALLITGISIFPQFLCKPPYGYLLSQLRNRSAKFVDILSTIVFWIGSVVISHFIHNLSFIALWGLIVQICTLLLLYLLVNRKIVWQFSISKNSFTRIFHFSFFSFIEMLAVMLFQQFDRVLVGLAINPSAAGVYSVSTSVGGRISTLVGQATDVMVPYASRKYSLEEKDQVLLMYRRLSKAVSLLTGFIGSVLILWMDKFLSIWISPEYANKYAIVFRLIVIAYSLLSLSRPAHQTLTGIGKVKFTSTIYLILTLVMLGFLYYLAMDRGLIGASIANLLMLFLLTFNLYLYRLEKGKNFLLNFFTDNLLGLSLPILSFIISDFSSKISFRLLATLGILFALFVGFFTDKYLSNRILILLKQSMLLPKFLKREK